MGFIDDIVERIRGERLSDVEREAREQGLSEAKAELERRNADITDRVAKRDVLQAEIEALEAPVEPEATPETPGELPVEEPQM